MNQQTHECRIDEWADLVGASVPDWACDEPRSRRGRSPRSREDVRTSGESLPRDRGE